MNQRISCVVFPATFRFKVQQENYMEKLDDKNQCQVSEVSLTICRNKTQSRLHYDIQWGKIIIRTLEIFYFNVYKYI